MASSKPMSTTKDELEELLFENFLNGLKGMSESRAVDERNDSSGDSDDERFRTQAANLHLMPKPNFDPIVLDDNADITILKRSSYFSSWLDVPPVMHKREGPLTAGKFGVAMFKLSSSITVHCACAAFLPNANQQILKIEDLNKSGYSVQQERGLDGLLVSIRNTQNQVLYSSRSTNEKGAMTFLIQE